MNTARDLVALLSRHGTTVAVAESCTGGLIGGAITSVPGSSNVFPGGVIAYANEIKRDVLGIPEAVLSSEGAVSEAVVKAMASGARRLLGATWAVAVSGIAGPDGGTTEKPVGLVWVAVDGSGGTTAQQYVFKGGREEVRAQTVQAALEDLLSRVRRQD